MQERLNVDLLHSNLKFNNDIYRKKHMLHLCASIIHSKLAKLAKQSSKNMRCVRTSMDILIENKLYQVN